MTTLIAGLLLFLGVHSLRILADDWRAAQIARIGARKWKGLFALVSLIGFVLIIWGFGQARGAPVTLWDPPAWTRYVTSLLLLPSFVLIVAGNMPGTKMK